MNARSLFVGGTSSNAGKSWMTTAICAWLRRQGVSVAPFKAQNMSNNSYPCRSGGEIGRAQVAQAEACGLEPEPAMNPVLLKPAGDGRSQVIVNGRVWKTLQAREYYACADDLRPVVQAAYADLARRFDVVIIEGAGSVTELNLRDHDLVNLGLVTSLRSPWMLVADIERGGVFGSVIGTVGLLTDHERALFRGFAINKFRGDTSLFDDGVPLLEERTASACLGVFPYAADVRLDAEDSLALDARRQTSPPPNARIAIVHLPRISNATDFSMLDWADWITAVPEAAYDFVILPGTKNTTTDLSWLRATGLADWVCAQHARGATLIGICGGYQMMGRVIRDPAGMESTTGDVNGLNLLPVSTELTPHKRTTVVSATTPRGVTFGAYEIHLGITDVESPDLPPFARLADGRAEGVRIDGLIGTYLHGAFENADVCAEVFGVRPRAVASRAENYDRMATWFESHVRHAELLGLR